jgi:hypothetical protein
MTYVFERIACPPPLDKVMGMRYRIKERDCPPPEVSPVRWD